MGNRISISFNETAFRVVVREFVNPIHLIVEDTKRTRDYMNEPRKQQLGMPPPTPQNPTLKTWKKRWHIKSLLVVMLLIVLIAGTYLLRSVLFPNYLGVGIAVCVVAFGLFLVRGAIRMLLEFDKLEEQVLKQNESSTSPSEANGVGHQTDSSAHPPEI